MLHEITEYNKIGIVPLNTIGLHSSKHAAKAHERLCVIKQTDTSNVVSNGTFKSSQ